MLLPGQFCPPDIGGLWGQKRWPSCRSITNTVLTGCRWVPVRFVAVIQSVVIPSLLVINSTGRFSTTGSTADRHKYHSRLWHGMFPDCNSIIAETSTPTPRSLSSSKGKVISTNVNTGGYSWRANLLRNRDHATYAHPCLPIQSSSKQNRLISSTEVDGVTWLHQSLCSEVLCPPGSNALLISV